MDADERLPEPDPFWVSDGLTGLSMDGLERSILAKVRTYKDNQWRWVAVEPNLSGQTRIAINRIARDLRLGMLAEIYCGPFEEDPSGIHFPDHRRIFNAIDSMVSTGTRRFACVVMDLVGPLRGNRSETFRQIVDTCWRNKARSISEPGCGECYVQPWPKWMIFDKEYESPIRILGPHPRVVSAMREKVLGQTDGPSIAFTNIKPSVLSWPLANQSQVGEAIDQ